MRGVSILNPSSLAVFCKPRAFALFHPRAHIRGINQFFALRLGISFRDLRPDFLAIRSQPSLPLVQHRDRVFHELIHALVSAALDVLLDHLLDLRPQVNVHARIIPRDASPSARNQHATTHTASDPVPRSGSHTYPRPYLYEYLTVHKCVSVSRGTFPPR